ncbi:hypothetical protein K470DRAFT_264694 [Piedraia hortae CBS 480.64]|uniref:Uncharacterized protein n=1 Tax=Piedraia hortae CBS 480.64 TaxID=1314780 RepID=A0A6A7BZ20_9PEZI|nr:hypothetical protein K470DRAFT_264694 [Piedraia hortae CBS 480.64]
MSQQTSPHGSQSRFSEEKHCKEASKSATTALHAQKKANQLKQAAAGAADPEERQKLLNDYFQKQVEAEKWGKAAKSLQSGALQGLLAGGGFGTGIGVGLGTITGVLVGGLIATVTGGLGAAVGSGVGAIGGPFLKIGHVAGNALGKISRTIPGWKATDEQKKALEKMLDLIEEQEVPDQAELERIQGQVKSVTNQVGSATKAAQNGPPGCGNINHSDQQTGHDSNGKPRAKPRKLEIRSADQSSATKSPRKPRKLEVRTQQAQWNYEPVA